MVHSCKTKAKHIMLKVNHVTHQRTRWMAVYRESKLAVLRPLQLQ